MKNFTPNQWQLELLLGIGAVIGIAIFVGARDAITYIQNKKIVDACIEYKSNAESVVKKHLSEDGYRIDQEYNMETGIGKMDIELDPINRKFFEAVGVPYDNNLQNRANALKKCIEAGVSIDNSQ